MLQPSVLLGIGVFMWPVTVFFVVSPIHMLAHTSWAQLMMLLLRLSAVRDLWTTTYGQVLLLKLALVGLALAWGAAHHLLVRPALQRGAEPPGGRIGRSLIGESLVGVAVLLAAALLVNTAPPDRRPPLDESRALVGGQ